MAREVLMTEGQLQFGLYWQSMRLHLIDAAVVGYASGFMRCCNEYAGHSAMGVYVQPADAVNQTDVSVD